MPSCTRSAGRPEGLPRLVLQYPVELSTYASTARDLRLREHVVASDTVEPHSISFPPGPVPARA
jgi:hypothetical protein